MCPTFAFPPLPYSYGGYNPYLPTKLPLSISNSNTLATPFPKPNHRSIKQFISRPLLIVQLSNKSLFFLQFLLKLPDQFQLFFHLHTLATDIRIFNLFSITIHSHRNFRISGPIIQQPIFIKIDQSFHKTYFVYFSYFLVIFIRLYKILCSSIN